MGRPKGSKNKSKQDSDLLSNNDRIHILAELIVNAIINERKTNNATIKTMNLPIVPIPIDDKSKPANLIRKLDTEAKEQGKSGWLELMIEQSPEMADIFRRMVGAEIAAKKNQPQATQN